MVYTGCFESCFTKIVLTFQRNSTLVTTNQPPAETNSEELQKLFSLYMLTTLLPDDAIKETAEVKLSQ